jgi:cell division septal protein FtsQ
VKQAARSRRGRSPAVRLKRFWFLAFVVLALAGAGTSFLVTWPALRPQHVVIKGNLVVARGEIERRAEVDWGENLWLQNVGAMAQRISTIPYIDRVVIHRRLPGTLAIDVTERVPYLVVESGRWQALVDVHLRVLQRGTSQADAGLPVLIAPPGLQLLPGRFLREADLRTLRDDEQTLRAAGVEPARLQRGSYGGLVATLHDGIRVLFGGDGDLAEKATLVGPILRQIGSLGRPIAALDLRAPNTPVVVYRPRHQ